MESRGIYQHLAKQDGKYIIDMGRDHFISCAMPILAEGDVIGCVLTGIPAGGSEFEKIADNIEAKLIQTAGIFLGKQMES